MMRVAIGTVLPSSNRIVERTTAAILAHLPGVDACFARIRYAPDGGGQPDGAYDEAGYAEAAALLGHAAVASVVWNGTRGAALGLDRDRALVALMGAAAGCKAATTGLAAAELLGRLGARRIAFVMPGAAADAAQHGAGLAPAGVTTVGARGLGCTDNLAAAAVAPGAILEAARALMAEARPDAILVWSTNLPGFEVMAALEAETGITVLDSAAVGVAAALAAAGVPTAPLAGLGRMFGAG